MDRGEKIGKIKRLEGGVTGRTPISPIQKVSLPLMHKPSVRKRETFSDYETFYRPLRDQVT
jgi:hypothetical protein